MTHSRYLRFTFSKQDYAIPLLDLQDVIEDPKTGGGTLLFQGHGDGQVRFEVEHIHSIVVPAASQVSVDGWLLLSDRKIQLVTPSTLAEWQRRGRAA